MRILAAVTTCRWRKAQADSQRATWAADSPIDVRFFTGDYDGGECGDSVCLPCRDDYKALPAKIQGMCRWAAEHDYDFVFKLDDDVYARPERFHTAVGDYVGLYRDGTWQAPGGYCSGFGYCLSRKSCEIVANAPTPDMEAEDVWVARQLDRSGIVGKHDSRFVITLGRLKNGTESPTAFNNLILSAEYKDMTEPHNQWLHSLEEWEEVSKTILL